MRQLTEYAESINSQFGEDGIIREIFNRMGIINGGLCIEVGASDGRECSNTLALRDNHQWRRILIEADEILYERQEDHPLDTRIHATIEAEGNDSLDQLPHHLNVDFLSLDIDGDDYNVLQHLKMTSKLICAEFNQTIPWRFSLKSAQIGCSLQALCLLMFSKGYRFIGATQCNAFFVGLESLHLFDDINQDPWEYLNQDNFTYLITTPSGGAVCLGPQFFGVHKRYVGELDVVDPATGEVRTINLSHRSARPK